MPNAPTFGPNTASPNVVSRLVSEFHWEDDDTLFGWVIDVDNPSRPALAEILINDILFRVERCTGLIDRAEISGVAPALQENWAQITAKFKILAGAVRYRVPEYIPRSKPVKVTVRHLESKAVLFEDVRDLGGEVRKSLVEMAEANPFIRFRAELDGDKAVKVIAHYAGPDEVELFATGGARVISSRQTAVEPPAHFLSFLDRRDYSLVVGSLEIPADDAGCEVLLRRVSDGAAIGDSADVFPVPPSLVSTYAAWKMPEPFRIDRVMASEASADYFFTGYATFCAIEHALTQAGGILLRDCRRILDWGCGVGRLTQHLLNWTPAAVTGIDIDQSAIDWCNTNLSRGNFSVAPLDPPTGLPDASFDLIIGISVFTHIDQSTQDAWLAELQRLLAPGGFALVSVNAMQSLVAHAHPLVEFQRMRRNGITDVIGTRLDGVLPSERSTYYREMHHSHDYIVDRWSRWFDVIAILPGAHFHHQDYVVLRRRSTVVPATRIERLQGAAVIRQHVRRARRRSSKRGA